MQSFVLCQMSDGVLNAVCYVTCVGDTVLISPDPPAAAAATVELVLKTRPQAQSQQQQKRRQQQQHRFILRFLCGVNFSSTMRPKRVTKKSAFLRQ